MFSNIDILTSSEICLLKLLVYKACYLLWVTNSQSCLCTFILWSLQELETTVTANDEKLQELAQWQSSAKKTLKELSKVKDVPDDVSLHSNTLKSRPETVKILLLIADTYRNDWYSITQNSKQRLETSKMTVIWSKSQFYAHVLYSSHSLWNEMYGMPWKNFKISSITVTT